MQQLDLFDKTADSYLWSELQKTKTSMRKQLCDIFALLTEVQNKLKQLEEKDEKKIHGNVM